MTQPDYPLMVLPGYEMYQLAHIATYLAEGVARHHAARTDVERDHAVQQLAGGSVALTRLGVPADQVLSAVLDVATFHAARGLVAGPRWAETVSLAPVGQPGWAVIGFVPGVGPVGARVANQVLAEALHRHVLTQTAAELAPWAIIDQPPAAPVVPPGVDMPAFVGTLDPRRDRDQAVVRSLRGLSANLDRVIGERFAGVDLDKPGVLRPPPGPPTASPVAPHRARGHRPRYAARSDPTAPTISAGP